MTCWRWSQRPKSRQKILARKRRTALTRLTANSQTAFGRAFVWRQPASRRKITAMRRIGIDKATEAGSTAGLRWASASRNILRLERLRDWLTSERRGVGDLNRFVLPHRSIYGRRSGGRSAVFHSDAQGRATGLQLLGKARRVAAGGAAA